MMPSLEKLNAFSVAPDLDGINLWDKDCSLVRKALQSNKPAVYAFYRMEGGMVRAAYVGSAGSKGLQAAHFGPLWKRLGAYRKLNSLRCFESRVFSEHQRDPLTLRVWFCGSTGECRKYEVDTIELEQPFLNQSDKITRTEAEYTLYETEKHKRHRVRYAQTEFDPALMKVCTKCQQAKANTEFVRCRNAPTLTKGICKACAKTNWKAPAVMYDPAARRVCTICTVEKPFEDFPRNRRHASGISAQCLTCRQTARRRGVRLAQIAAQRNHSMGSAKPSL